MSSVLLRSASASAVPTPAWLTRLRTPGRWLATLYVLVVVLLMTSTGWMALREGATRYLQPFLTQNAGSLTAQQAAQLRAHPSSDKLNQYSNELGILAMWTSPQRFIDSRLIEHGMYLSRMPRLNQVLLTAHIFLGVFCMLFGGLQFWPLFRKRFMKTHRLIGVGYVATAPISVLLSFAYMAVTPPHLLYTRLTSFVALWLFGSVAIGAIAMAVLALKRKRIHEHMAFMALSFACLLVAPMLRWNWVGLAWLFPHIDQETLNVVTMGIMLPECLLIGYGLMLVNRQYGRAMSRRPLAEVAQRTSKLLQSWSPLLYLAAGAFTLINILHYVSGHGMTSASAAKALIPAALLSREAGILNAHPWLGIVFGLSVSLALLTGLRLLQRLLALAPQGGLTHLMEQARAWSVLALVAGQSAIAIGWQIGLEPHEVILSGGTLYTVGGLLITAFAALFAGATASRHLAMMKESMALILSVLPFSALFFVNLWCLQWMPIPSDYIQAGQAYVLSAGASTALMFLAMFYVVYGQATREHG